MNFRRRAEVVANLLITSDTEGVSALCTWKRMRASKRLSSIVDRIAVKVRSSFEKSRSIHEVVIGNVAKS